MGKVPLLKDLLIHLEWIRWCLVVHVNLANLVWFTAIPVGLVHRVLYQQSATVNDEPAWSSTLGFILAVFGVLFMMTSFPGRDVEVILSNYIPVVTHFRHKIGLGLYFLGVVLNYMSLEALIPRKRDGATESQGLEDSRFGLWIGSLFSLFACLALVHSHFSARGLVFPSSKLYFELTMWGGGHLLQHSSSVFVVVVWVLLLSTAFQKRLFSREELFPVFAWLGLPILIVPLLFQYPITSNDYREGFSFLMRWGIAPPIILFIGMLAFRLRKRTSSREIHSILAAVVWSLGLMLLGFVFGAFIRGADMRVPAHYHATIGSVTLAFMGISYEWLRNQKISAHKTYTYSIWSYGVGQTLFSSGMFIAGSFGMERKTYGSELVFLNAGQKIGFFVMATGGILALTGGICFGVVILRCLNFTMNFKKIKKGKKKNEEIILY